MAASTLTMQKIAAPSSSFAGRAVTFRQSPVRVQQARITPVTAAAAQARQSWLPGSAPPKHLTGKQAGDFGFDPLGLGKDPAALEWYTQSELIHCRTAMAAVAGILIPALLTKAGILNVPAWYEAGRVVRENNPVPIWAEVWVEFALVHFVEVKRWQDIRKKGSQAEKGSFLGLEAALGGSDDLGYPGGIFNPLNVGTKNAEQLAEYRLKEVKNGRLAMLAFLGFGAQYIATGKGPLENLGDHVANPFGANFATNGVSLPTNFPFNEFPGPLPGFTSSL